MRPRPFAGAGSRLATVVLVVAGAASAGAATRDVTVTTVTSTSTSSVTSSTFVSGGIGECDFDLIVPDGGTFESLSLSVGGPLMNTRCELASIPELEGAILYENPFGEVAIVSISQPLPPGVALLHCDSDEFIEGGQTVTVDFTDVGSAGMEALGPGGEPVDPPRLCASGLSCSYFGGGDLDWIGDPRCGDADYDWRVRAIDALRALRTSVGQPSCVPFPSVCNADGDLQVTASDALLILKASVQLAVTLACPVPCGP